MSFAPAILAAMNSIEPPEPQVRFHTTARLRASGRSPGQIRTLVRHGGLVPVGRGVYVPKAIAREFAGAPNGDHLLRAAAALAHNWPECVISHQSAALAHNIDLVGEQPTEVTLTARHGGRRGRRHGVHTYANAMPGSQITRKFGLPVTTPARTVIDIARTAGFAAGVVAADSALHQGLTTQAELWHVAEQCRLRRGGDQADRAVKFADGRAESPLESLARIVFDENGIPAPELQVVITSANGQFVGRVDFLWRTCKVIVEVDGAVKYDDDPRRARAQLWRDKALRAAGYEVIHFNWAEITTEPEQTAAAIRAALCARGGAEPGQPG